MNTWPLAAEQAGPPAANVPAGPTRVAAAVETTRVAIESARFTGSPSLDARLGGDAHVASPCWDDRSPDRPWTSSGTPVRDPKLWRSTPRAPGVGDVALIRRQEARRFRQMLPTGALDGVEAGHSAISSPIHPELNVGQHEIGAEGPPRAAKPHLTLPRGALGNFRRRRACLRSRRRNRRGRPVG